MNVSILIIVCATASLCALISVILNVYLIGKVLSDRVSLQSPADDELAAVITAAIVVATGMPPSSFRLADVVRAGDFSTPVWGHAERFAGV